MNELKHQFWHKAISTYSDKGIFDSWVSDCPGRDAETNDYIEFAQITCAITLALDDERCANILKMMRDMVVRKILHPSSLHMAFLPSYLLPSEKLARERIDPIMKLLDAKFDYNKMSGDEVVQVWPIRFMLYRDIYGDKYQPKKESLPILLDILLSLGGPESLRNLSSYLFKQKQFLNDTSTVIDTYTHIKNYALQHTDCALDVTDFQQNLLNSASLHARGGAYYDLHQAISSMPTPEDNWHTLNNFYRLIKKAEKEGDEFSDFEALSMCQCLLSRRDVSSVINRAFTKDSVKMVCDFYNMTPIDALPLSNNTLTHRAILDCLS